MTARSGLCVATAALGLSLVSTVARSEPRPGLHLTATGCARFRLDRVQELLEVELATLLPAAGALSKLDVDYQCSASRVRVTVVDAVTGKLVSRETPLEERADPERLMALVASELFLASWSELLVREPEEPARGADPVLQAATHAVERASNIHRHAPTLAVDLLETLRARRVSGSSVPTLQAALRVQQASAVPWQWLVLVGWETGVEERALGRVEMTAMSAGAGVQWGLHFAHGDFGVTGSASAAYFMLRGVPASSAIYGRRAQGLVADLSLGLEANVTFDPLRFGAVLCGGVVGPEVSGGVEGDVPVRFDGGWAGVTLFAGLQF